MFHGPDEELSPGEGEDCMKEADRLITEYGDAAGAEGPDPEAAQTEN